MTEDLETLRTEIQAIRRDIAVLSGLVFEMQASQRQIVNILVDGGKSGQGRLEALVTFQTDRGD